MEDSVDLSSPRQFSHLLRGSSTDAVIEINSKVLHKPVGNRDIIIVILSNVQYMALEGDLRVAATCTVMYIKQF